MKILRKMTHLALAAAVAFGFGTASLVAQDPAPPAAPAAAPAAAAPAEPAVAPAAAPAAEEKKEPTAEDKANDVMAYFNNVAPTGPLKDLPGPGHNGFLMICAALVLFMTLPGLALFYGGLVRRKNVLSVLAQCLGCAGLVTILWFTVGYSLVFGEHPAEGAPAYAPYLGSLKYMFLDGVGAAPNTNYTAWPSHSTFSMYQLMFAIITPALIVGAIAERMKFSAIMLFIGIWMFVVYFPLAHMVWGFDGLMNGVWNSGAKIAAIDFAGGTVVHMSSGWSALVLCIMLGKRHGFGKEKMAPHSMVLCMVGTGMLWVGWYGFNAGSALAADGIASSAFLTTTLAAATAGFVWAIVEGLHKGKISILGFCSGIVAGLVVITPACGFVTAKGAMVIGVLAAVIPYFAVVILKSKLGYDDALDTFGVHGVGGTLGAILTGILATDKVNANLVSETYAKPNGLAKAVTEGGLLTNQLLACLITIVLSVVATVVITLIVKAIIGLRPSTEDEVTGLDVTDHGEESYSL
jgi:ammonium transporter, Amt family